MSKLSEPKPAQLTLPRILGAVATIAASVWFSLRLSQGVSGFYDFTVYSHAILTGLLSSIGATIGVLRRGAEGLVRGVIAGILISTLVFPMFLLGLFIWHVIESGGELFPKQQ